MCGRGTERKATIEYRGVSFTLSRVNLPLNDIGTEILVKVEPRSFERLLSECISIRGTLTRWNTDLNLDHRKR